MHQIYFAEGPEGAIKIGLSTNPVRRMQWLQFKNYPHGRARLIANAPGGRDVERALHFIFRKSRIGGEWFKPTKKLDLLIRGVLSEGKIPAEITENTASLKNPPGAIATIRIPESQAKRLAKIVDKRHDPFAPTTTQIFLRGLELSLKELERK